MRKYLLHSERKKILFYNLIAIFTYATHKIILINVHWIKIVLPDFHIKLFKNEMTPYETQEKLWNKRPINMKFIFLFLCVFVWQEKY